MDTNTRKPNKLLRRERESRGWTLEEVADALDQLCQEQPQARRRGMINDSMISRWERGIHPPSSFHQRKLCQLFEKSAEELGFLDPLPSQVAEPFSQPPQLFISISSNTQQAPFTTFSPVQAIDVLNAYADAAPDQQLGVWLALSAQHLSLLFDAGWTPQKVLEVLHVLLPGVHAMSQISRRAFGKHLLQLGAAAVLSGIPMPSGRHISAEERMALHQTLGESIAAGWNLFHTAGNAQVLSVGQAQLALVQQAHALLYPSVRAVLYTGVYNLIGMAQHFQEHHEEALQAHMSAHVAALGAGDPWLVAQSLISLALTYQALGRYSEAIQSLEEAQRTIGHIDEEHLRTRAHLLGCWADCAMSLGEYTLAQQKLDEAATYLDQIMPKEEFDRTSWLQLAGKRALMIGDHKQATHYLEEALAANPPQWLIRRSSILIPLAIAYARLGERDVSLQVAQQAVPVMAALNAPMTNNLFIDYIRQDLLGLFPHDSQMLASITEMQHQLPQIAHAI
jgi:tetratricopeptide (TPR) repeat protein/transcriptional regulator with XRE-family HTH domain